MEWHARTYAKLEMAVPVASRRTWADQAGEPGGRTAGEPQASEPGEPARMKIANRIE